MQTAPPTGSWLSPVKCLNSDLFHLTKSLPNRWKPPTTLPAASVAPSGSPVLLPGPPSCLQQAGYGHLGGAVGNLVWCGEGRKQKNHIKLLMIRKATFSFYGWDRGAGAAVGPHPCPSASWCRPRWTPSPRCPSPPPAPAASSSSCLSLHFSLLSSYTGCLVAVWTWQATTEAAEIQKNLSSRHLEVGEVQLLLLRKKRTGVDNLATTSVYVLNVFLLFLPYLSTFLLF